MMLFHELYLSRKTQLGLVFHCRSVGSVKALLVLETDSNVKPKRCLFTVETMYMTYYVPISTSEYVRIPVLC